MKTNETQPAWTPSKVEEVIAALWTIAGLCAWTAGIGWLGWVLIIKAVFDTITAIGFAVVEILTERAAIAKTKGEP